MMAVKRRTRKRLRQNAGKTIVVIQKMVIPANAILPVAILVLVHKVNLAVRNRNVLQLQAAKAENKC